MEGMKKQREMNNEKKEALNGEEPNKREMNEW